jgi:hypothetical protein
MTDDLVKRLRSANDESFVETFCGEAADRIDALTAERDRLWEALMDAREAWDNHMEYGEPMQGWWVADALAALNTGKEVMPNERTVRFRSSDIGPGDQAVAGAVPVTVEDTLVDRLARSICLSAHGDTNPCPVPDELMPRQWMILRDRYHSMAHAALSALATQPPRSPSRLPGPGRWIAYAEWASARAKTPNAKPRSSRRKAVSDGRD